MEKDITPKKTILFLTLLMSVASYFMLDYHYKTRARDVIFTVINSSTESIKVNNFMQFSSNLKNVLNREPYIKGIQIFDHEFRRLINFGEEIDIATEFYKFNGDQVQLIHKGPLEYAIKYLFHNDSELIMIAFLEDENRYYTLFFSIFCIFLLFGIIYFLCQRLDIDNLNSRAAKHALDLMSCGFHEMKQTVELFRILQTQLAKNEVTFLNPTYAEVFSQDFKQNMISVDSMMSILKLTNDKDQDISNCTTELKTVISDCVNTYKFGGRNVDIKYNHNSLLNLSEDILYATIGNLIKNAYRYSDSLIWIRTSESGGWLYFSVANTGKEIPKEKQKSILKPGVALQGQTGLGLHICHIWCKRIGARLSLESTKTATQFTIASPISRHPNSSFRKKKTPNRSVTTTLADSNKTAPEKNVAVIDDLETFRISICEQISEFCSGTEHFENIDLFLDQIRDNPKRFNYILVDRHGHGFDAVRDRFPDSCKYYGYTGKIILYSSDISDLEEPEYRAKGFDHFVKKGQQIDWESYLQ